MNKFKVENSVNVYKIGKVYFILVEQWLKFIEWKSLSSKTEKKYVIFLLKKCENWIVEIKKMF